jgi:hypothetical protein
VPSQFPGRNPWGALDPTFERIEGKTAAPPEGAVFSAKSSTIKSPWGQVITRHLEGTVMESTYLGHYGAELARSVLEIMPELMRGISHPTYLLDMSGVTGSDAGASLPAAGTVEMFCKQGGDRFVVVVASGSLRMMLISTAFAVGLPMKIFQSRDEALAFLRAPRSRSRRAPRRSSEGSHERLRSKNSPYSNGSRH